MLNIKAIIPTGNEALLAAAWKAERKDFKRRKEPALYQPTNHKKTEEARELRERIYGMLLAGLDTATKITRVVGKHESTVRTHLKALKEDGRAEIEKDGNPVIWRAVK